MSLIGLVLVALIHWIESNADGTHTGGARIPKVLEINAAFTLRLRL